MKPVPHLQRRRSHKRRRALAKALHSAAASRYSFGKMARDAAKAAGRAVNLRIRVPKYLRDHKRLILQTLAGR